MATSVPSIKFHGCAGVIPRMQPYRFQIVPSDSRRLNGISRSFLAYDRSLERKSSDFFRPIRPRSRKRFSSNSIGEKASMLTSRSMNWPTCADLARSRMRKGVCWMP